MAWSPSWVAGKNFCEAISSRPGTACRYTYPEGGVMAGNGLVSAVGDSCTVLDARYTAQYMKDQQ